MHKFIKYNNINIITNIHISGVFLIICFYDIYMYNIFLCIIQNNK